MVYKTLKKKQIRTKPFQNINMLRIKKNKKNFIHKKKL